MQRMSEFYIKKIQQEGLRPKVGENELIHYISTAYTGIQTCSIVYHCYSNNPIAVSYSPRQQHRVLAKTVNYLLGIEE